MLYFVIPNKEHYLIAFSDIDKTEKVIILSKLSGYVSRALNRLEKLSGIDFIKKILYMLYPCSRLANKNPDAYFCFTDGTYKSINRQYFYYLKEKYSDIKIILLLYNKISLLYNRPGNEQLFELPQNGKDLCCDYIFTYDPEDSEYLGFPYWEIYSKLENLDVANIIKNDVFYCGSVAHAWKQTRYELIKEVYEYLVDREVLCNFKVTLKNEARNIESIFEDGEELSYKEIIKNDLQSNVILEIVSDGKCGPTFRYCEAVVYNIKLLTNNPNITRLPFYNPKYMRYFQKVEDIDIDWVKRKEEINYHYNGEFSPQTIYEQINNYKGTWNRK